MTGTVDNTSSVLVVPTVVVKKIVYRTWQHEDHLWANLLRFWWGLHGMHPTDNLMKYVFDHCLTSMFHFQIAFTAIKCIRGCTVRGHIASQNEMHLQTHFFKMWSSITSWKKWISSNLPIHRQNKGAGTTAAFMLLAKLAVSTCTHENSLFKNGNSVCSQ